MKSQNLSKQLKEAAKLYDNNEYSRGLKFVNKLLKQNPNNAELIAFKAIFLQFLKDPKGANELITKALKMDMKNSQIWKFNGIITKEQGEYVKALQSFTQSHRLDPNDTAVLNDMCNLHLYQRNYSELLQLSKELIKFSTISACIVRHILVLYKTGNEKLAFKCFDTYEGNFSKEPKNSDDMQFRTELYLFHAQLLIESKKYEECVQYLKKMSPLIMDSISVKEKLAKCYMQLNDNENAMKMALEMIEYYPENGDYFDILEKTSSKEEYLNLLDTIKDKYKSRYAEVRILELIDVNSPEFEDRLKKFLVPYLVKGAPSIFVMLEELSDQKIDVALRIAQEADVPISSIPIIHLFKANVLASRGNYEEALSEIEKGIKHTPTCIELYSAKLKINRKLGKISETISTGQFISESEPNDRNSNILYVNSLLRGGRLQDAHNAALPFSIDQSRKPKLLVTQFNDFHVRAGDCSYRARDYERATGFYQDVIKHFEEFRKSQFNYMTWGMRHISSSYELLKFVDELPQHPMLARGAVGLMKVKIIQNDLKPLAQIAFKMINATKYDALAYTAVYYALQNDPLPAIRCYKRIKGSWKFACSSVIQKMMNSISKLPQIIQEVAKEEFEPLNETPSTFLDYVCASRGSLFINDKETAKKYLLKAAQDFTYNYKEALDMYTVAYNEMADDEFAKTIQKEINNKYPTYELVFQYQNAEIPPEVDDS